jgi:hypothetical protein
LVNHAADDQGQRILAPRFLARVDQTVEFQLPGQVQQRIRSSVFALALDLQRSRGLIRGLTLAQSKADLLDELRRQFADVTDGAVEDSVALPIALADECRAVPLGSTLEFDFSHIHNGYTYSRNNTTMQVYIHHYCHNVVATHCIAK